GGQAALRGQGFQQSHPRSWRRHGPGRRAPRGGRGRSAHRAPARGLALYRHGADPVVTRPWLEPRAAAVSAGRRRISVLGVTGSIGTSTVDILERNRDRFAVEAVTAGSNVNKLAAIARRLDARYAAIGDPKRLDELR